MSFQLEIDWCYIRIRDVMHLVNVNVCVTSSELRWNGQSKMDPMNVIGCTHECLMCQGWIWNLLMLGFVL